MEELLKNLGPAPEKKSTGDKQEVVYVGDLEKFGGAKHEEKKKWLKETLEPALLKLSSHPSFTSTSSSTSPKIILTLGSAGSLALLPPSPSSSSSSRRSTIIFTPCSPLQGSVRDTTGAGDCFTGFFVGSLMKGQEEEEEVGTVVEALRVATQVSFAKTR